MVVERVRSTRDLAHILYVHHGMGIGGAPTSLAHLLDSLDRNRFEPIVMTRPSSAVSLFEQAGAQVILVGNVPRFQHTTAGSYSALDPRLYAELMRGAAVSRSWASKLRAWNPDIVHLNSVTLLPLCRAARDAGAKVVMTVRETVISGTWGLRKQFIRNTLKNEVDAVLHISEYDRQMLDVHSPIVRVIPNWVDFNRFDRRLSGESIRRELGLAPEQRIVLTLGGGTPIKGTLDFCHAAKRLADRDDLVFVVAGLDPPQAQSSTPRNLVKREAKRMLGLDTRERIYEYVQTQGLANRIHFIGMRSDVPNVLAACHMLVFPSTRGHQARPLFEAGAMAKPVIVTDFPCLREYAIHEQNALMTPPRCPKALATAILRLADDPVLAQALGEANYASAMQDHNMVYNAPKVSAIYDDLLGRSLSS